MAVGLRFGCALAGVGYGLSASFRQALSERGLAWTDGGAFHPSSLSLMDFHA
ncbi:MULTISPECIES: hypothetical protein [unclassified Bosea (in: a-proteobacteria)]|uniref:hypothetical protein n=1 Tax=unclassified Bosea (in: a-proteobacteria) TaxID=2653178 RepID=UPI0019D0E7DA|nr:MULTISPECIES: hypothetical protein [unclassified Bosea (in: a-proteobacteria)]